MRRTGIALSAALLVLPAPNVAKSQNLDHLVCYTIRDELQGTARANLNLLDSSPLPDPAPGCRIVTNSRELCVPATKDVTAYSGTPLVYDGDVLTDQYLCYRLRCTSESVASPTVNDQFGARQVQVREARRLCVPASAGNNPKIIFVSSVTNNGFFAGGSGGRQNADNLCNALAGSAGLPGSYKSWLSNEVDDARGDGLGAGTRPTSGSGPFVRTDGVLVATSVADLLDGNLLNPISKDENGNAFGGTNRVWTGTSSVGEHFHDLTCESWQNGGSNKSGYFGLADAAGPEWTAIGAAECFNQHRLYCFQQ